MRIDKLLSNMGIGSRKEVKEYIKKGLVKVNGKTVTKATQKVNPDLDKIEYENEILAYEKYTYLMLNKPQGYISATSSYSQKTVLDLLDKRYLNRGLFPAGRLDKDTEGLLLITNDGRLAHNLLSPKKGVIKKYFVKVDKNLVPEDVQAFSEGVFLEENQYLTRPAKLEIVSDTSAYVYIDEGKYHQVKRMLKSLGKQVTYLQRLAMGPLSLDPKLELGDYRKLSEAEIKALQEQNNLKMEDEMTEKNKKLEEEKIEEKQKQDGSNNVTKPSSDIYSNVEERDAETGVEKPTEQAVEDAMQWVEENRK